MHGSGRRYLLDQGMESRQFPIPYAETRNLVRERGSQMFQAILIVFQALDVPVLLFRSSGSNTQNSPRLASRPEQRGHRLQPQYEKSLICILVECTLGQRCTTEFDDEGKSLHYEWDKVFDSNYP